MLQTEATQVPKPETSNQQETSSQHIAPVRVLFETLPQPAALAQLEEVPQSSGLGLTIRGVKRHTGTTAGSIASSSSSARHAREAELMRQQAEDAKRRAEIEKREAALLEAEAKIEIERQRRELLADRRVMDAEAAAAVATIHATYASVCGSEVGNEEHPILLDVPQSASTMYENLPNPPQMTDCKNETNINIPVPRNRVV